MAVPITRLILYMGGGRKLQMEEHACCGCEVDCLLQSEFTTQFNLLNEVNPSQANYREN